MIARVPDRLDEAIREVIGNNPEMVAEFRVALDEVHRVMVDAATEHNTALAQIYGAFGVDDKTLRRWRRLLNGGGDPDQIKRFDELVEYASAHFPHALKWQRGHASSGTAEEAFAVAVADGMVPVPKPWDDAVIQETISRLGPQFFESYGEFVPPVSDVGLERRIRYLVNYAVEMRQNIEAGWKWCQMMYKLRRLVQAINNLPPNGRDAAVERCGLEWLKGVIVTAYLSVDGVDVPTKTIRPEPVHPSMSEIPEEIDF